MKQTQRRRGSASRLIRSIAVFAFAILFAAYWSDTRAAIADYPLNGYIEYLPVKQHTTDTVGIVPYAVVPSYAYDADGVTVWIYYEAPCGFYLDGTSVDPDCPQGAMADPNFPTKRNPTQVLPDFRIHIWRVKSDGTGNHCLTCGSFNDGVYWMHHSGVPEVHGSFMLFTKTRPNTIDEESACGNGITAPGGGVYDDLWVMNLSTSAIYELYVAGSNPGFSGDLPGSLDPRWSDDGNYVLWSDRVDTGTHNPNDLLGAWQLAAANFVASDGDKSTPHIHGVSLAGTSPNQYLAPNTSSVLPVFYQVSAATGGYAYGTRIPGGFTRNASGLSGAYFGGNIVDGQSAADDNISAFAFATPGAGVNLTGHYSATNPNINRYEEHSHLNEVFYDEILYMSGNPPPTGCILNGLGTELYMMDPNGAHQTALSAYNPPYTPPYTPPATYNPTTVVSKLSWAPNGVEAVVSVNYNSPPSGTSPNQLAIYRFGHWTNPTQNSASAGFTNPTNAYRPGGGVTTYVYAGADGTNTYHHYYLSLPNSIPTANVTVSGVSVRLDWYVDSAINPSVDHPYMAVKLSWDGGTHWTNWGGTPVGSQTERTDTISASTGQTSWTEAGGSTPHAWTREQLSNANFRVMVAVSCGTTPNSCAAGRTFNLDWIPVLPTWSAH